MAKRPIKNRSLYRSPSLQWLPDWKDVASYKQKQNLSYREWAWEFLRRNDKYRHLREEALKEFRHRDLEKAKYIRVSSDDKGDLVVTNPKRAPKELEAIAESFYSLFHLGVFPPDPAEDKPNITFEIPKIFKSLKSLRDYEFSDNEVICLIDLKANIEDQLKSLKVALKKRKRATSFKKNTRNQKALFASYLRTLDAHLSKATISEMAQVFYPKSDNSYEAGRGVTKRIRNNLKQAISLQKTAFRDFTSQDK